MQKNMSKNTKRIRAHAHKWPGVYYYEMAVLYNGKPDRCYSYTIKVGTRKIWRKVGRASEGFGPEIAAEYRSRALIGLAEGTEVLTPKEEREDTLSKDKTIAELGQVYFDIKTGSVKGIRTDQNRFDKHILPRFGSKRVSQIVPIDIEYFKKALLGTHMPGTVWNILELFRRIVNYGFKTIQCPALGFVIEMPEKDNAKVEYLTTEQAARFLKTAREWLDRDVGRMVEVAYFTGMRRGELFKMEERDIDFDVKLITIRDPKSGKKTETIGMSDVVAAILSEQIASNRVRRRDATVRFIFPGKKDGVPRVDCSGAERIKVAADLPKDFRPFHGLRHNFGVTLANSGKFNISEISEALTHKNLTFTKERYAQFLPDTLTKIGNSAASILNVSIEAP